MPITNRQDASDVDQHITEIFDAGSTVERAERIRRLFVEKLDFEASFQEEVSLEGTRRGVTLPSTGYRLASLETTDVVYVDLFETEIETDKVRQSDVTEAVRLIESTDSGSDVLMVFTNRSSSQIHFILPQYTGKKLSLRRMVLERELPRRTAIQQLSNIFWVWDRTRNIRLALESAFDVEAVTKDFFDRYRLVFDATKERVSGFGNDEVEQNLKNDFVQGVFNRLMFVYFLSRKGWLRFEGCTNYLNALWKSYESTPDQTNFYVDRLRHLFFVGLNNPGARNLMHVNPVLYALIGDVPFLNGGLFDKDKLDDRAGIVIPDDAIEKILKDLFNRFNFTVTESTPLDVEVAVDPEMLGKVFEETVNGRHESGAYYTPRPVVAFMCREALKGYIDGQELGISMAAIESLVDGRDESGLTPPQASDVSGALRRIRVLDPACGSGAYLLGMMQELVELQSKLLSDRLRTDALTLYKVKLEIIEKTLFGADNDQFAVNIAMLRLWLSLVVEFDDADGSDPPALPNLNYQIVCGDSLLGPNPGEMTLDRELIKTSGLGDLKAKYLHAKPRNKRKLQNQIKQVLLELSVARGDGPSTDGVVDWPIEFGDVLIREASDKPAAIGFDVVVANPPYVRQEQITADKTVLSRSYPEVYASSADIYVYFYSRAIQLMSTTGWIAFITSNTFTKRGFGAGLRGYLKDNLRIVRLVDFGEIDIFDATVEVMIVIGQKSSELGGNWVDGHNLYPLLARRIGRGADAGVIGRVINELPSHLADEVSRFRQQRLTTSGWRIEDEAVNDLFDRLMGSSVNLRSHADGRIFSGIKTGFNQAFVVDEVTKNELIKDNASNAELIHPWFGGRDINRWVSKRGTKYLIAIQNSDDASSANQWRSATTEREASGIFRELHPEVHDHLIKFESKLRERQDQGRYWWELRACAYFEAFKRPKIIWPDISRSIRFAYDTNGVYVGNTGYIMPVPDLWLLAVLNSELIEFLLCQITNTLRGGFMRVINQYVSRLPIVVPGRDSVNTLENIALNAISGYDFDQSELNKYVYALYGVSDSDIRVIDEWFERRSLVAKP